MELDSHGGIDPNSILSFLFKKTAEFLPPTTTVKSTTQYLTYAPVKIYLLFIQFFCYWPNFYLGHISVLARDITVIGRRWKYFLGCI